MDVAPTQAPATDDQELAKVLESMNNTLTTAPAGPVAAVDEPADTPADDSMQFEANDPVSANPVVPPAPVSAPEPVLTMPDLTTSDDVKPKISDVPERDEASNTPGEFDSIKQEALSELRPLVDKLDLSPEDKFNTLLLIIRSTDDKSLVPKAHEAAKGIEDESARASALLDIIKEIDYFSR